MSGVKRVLIVDDEMLNRRVLESFLKGLGHEVVSATFGMEALDMLDESIDLVLLDIMMPDMDGYEVCAAIREKHHCCDVPIIVVTALSSHEDRLRAVEAGANDFIAKPIDRTELKVRSNSLLKMKDARDQVKRYQSELEEMVQVRTKALEISLDNLRSLQETTRKAHLDTVHCLSFAAEYKDEDTAMHIQRMSHYSMLLARRFGLPESEVEMLRHASPMHDVGKIGVPDAILLKPGKLDAREWDIMKQHTTIGERILSQSNSELLQAGCTIAKSHHEKWDGSGYPEGLSGEDIPLYGRICAVADVFDALTSKRPYKDAFPAEKALEIMRQGHGSHFDPQLLDMFLRDFDEVLEIKERFTEC